MMKVHLRIRNTIPGDRIIVTEESKDDEGNHVRVHHNDTIRGLEYLVMVNDFDSINVIHVHIVNDKYRMFAYDSIIHIYDTVENDVKFDLDAKGDIPMPDTCDDDNVKAELWRVFYRESYVRVMIVLGLVVLAFAIAGWTLVYIGLSTLHVEITVDIPIAVILLEVSALLLLVLCSIFMFKNGMWAWYARIGMGE